MTMNLFYFQIGWRRECAEIIGGSKLCKFTGNHSTVESFVTENHDLVSSWHQERNKDENLFDFNDEPIVNIKKHKRS